MIKNNAKRFLIFSLFFLLLAGGQGVFTQDYLKPGDLNLADFITPPPEQNSERTKKELKEILDFQISRTDSMVALAKDDQKINVFRFQDVLGPKFTQDNLPLTNLFFQQAVSSALKVLDPVKEIYNRPRPYVADSRVKPCLDFPKNASYPSGHSTGGNFIAILLANMVPERKAEIYARGWQFAENRVIGGVHYRSDIEAGRICAALLAEKMFENPEFLRDYEAAKAELRKALGFRPQ